MNKVYFLIGGNIGDRKLILSKTIISIGENIGEVINTSAIYETEPWGFSHEQNFLNQVVVINTTKEPFEVLNALQKIEQELGRVRKKNRYSARTIDIDILFYNNLCINSSEELIIPHPRMQERMFALMPLCEIAFDLVHPKLNKTIAQLMDVCKDKLLVKKLQ